LHFQDFSLPEWKLLYLLLLTHLQNCFIATTITTTAAATADSESARREL
jgi:hypothetical protein